MMNAISLYRLARRLSDWHVPVIPTALDYVGRLLFACWIPHSADIGRGVIVGYGGLGIVIHSDAKIGARVHIDQGVTIGGNATEEGVPTIGDDVYIGAGAKVLGPIMVGEGSVIGANSVVIRSIEPRSVVAGIPARVIRSDINCEEFLHHRRTRK